MDSGVPREGGKLRQGYYGSPEAIIVFYKIDPSDWQPAHILGIHNEVMLMSEPKQVDKTFTFIMKRMVETGVRFQGMVQILRIIF